MPLPVAPLTEPSPAKSFLKLLPVEIQAEILSYSDEESFLALCVTCQYFFNENYFYEKRLLDNYQVKGPKRAEMEKEYDSKNILCDYTIYKMRVVYAQAKDFSLSKERESFLYINQLKNTMPVEYNCINQLKDTMPFEYNMFPDAARLGNLDLLLNLRARCQEKKDINFRFDIQILKNAVKSKNIMLLDAFFDSPFFFPINPRTLAIAAQSGNIKLMNKLFGIAIKQQKQIITFTVLKGAVFSGNRKLVELVIQYMDERKPRGDNKQTRKLVMAAASMLHIDLMDWLIKTYSMEITNAQMGYILAAVAAGGGDVDTINKIQATYTTEPLSLDRIRVTMLSAARGGSGEVIG